MGLTAFDGRLLWRGGHLENQGSVLNISRVLEEGLAAVGATVKDLTGIGVAVGPGSFTGIKVGLAFVHGLRMAFKTPVPCAPLVALEEAALTLAERRGTRDFGLLLPATRTHGYFAAVVGSSIVPARLVAFEGELGSEHLAPLPEGAPLAVFGGWPAAEAWRPAVKLSPSEVSDAAIYGMSTRSQALWPQGFGLAALAPRYLRLSTAEENLARQTLQQDQ